MYELDKGKFGRFVAGRRHELGLTQRELSSRLGVSDKAVSKWETGQSLPDVALVVPLAEALGVSASELLECRRFGGGEEMDSERVERLVRSALTLSDGPARPGAAERRARLGLYALALALGAAGIGGLSVAGGLWLRHGALMCGLSALFGLWFCFWGRERLPRYYDENSLSSISDGPFRMNLPGVRFNNRNWPHIMRVGRIWCLCSMAAAPWAELLCSALLPAGWEAAPLPAYLAALFVPLVIAARRHG